MAEKFARKIENQAEAGVLQTDSRKCWATFRGGMGSEDRRRHGATKQAMHTRRHRPLRADRQAGSGPEDSGANDRRVFSKRRLEKGKEGRKQSLARNGQQGTAASAGRPSGCLRMGIPAEDAENPHGEGAAEVDSLRHARSISQPSMLLATRPSGRSRMSTPQPTGGGRFWSSCT